MIMKRNIKDFLKRSLFNVYKLGARVGVHIIPVHYYSAMPDINELEKTKEIWAKKSELPGLNIDLDEQVRNLRAICLPYRSEYEGNSAYNFAVQHAFGPGYGYIEAQALHAIIRHYQPARVLEVGSGVSTWCALTALKMNKEETNKDFSITCIEPYPSAQLQALKEVELISKKAQTVPFNEGFSELKENDLLFIDSSHTVKPGSDVNYLILEILPRLHPGVIVHFHDIYLPYDYSPDVLKTFFCWMETSLLRAFLIYNPKAKIIFCESQLHYDRPKDLKEVFPEYNPLSNSNGISDKSLKPFEHASHRHFPASLYIQIQ